MHQQYIIEKLDSNTLAFKALLRNVSLKQANWRPSPKKWSINEVVNHLHDEEVDDFRQRLEFALSNPDRSWMRIEPEKWVIEKNYKQRDFQSSLENFLIQRNRSVLWLNGLHTCDWSLVDSYPFGIVLTAEQILVNWLAHDYLHIRQINKLNWSYLSHIAPSVDLGYAGIW